MCELYNISEPFSPPWHILLTHMYLWTNHLCMTLIHKLVLLRLSLNYQNQIRTFHSVAGITRFDGGGPAAGAEGARYSGGGRAPRRRAPPTPVDRSGLRDLRRWIKVDRGRSRRMRRRAAVGGPIRCPEARSGGERSDPSGARGPVWMQTPASGGGTWMGSSGPWMGSVGSSRRALCPPPKTQSARLHKA